MLPVRYLQLLTEMDLLTKFAWLEIPEVYCRESLNEAAGKVFSVNGHYSLVALCLTTLYLDPEADWYSVADILNKGNLTAESSKAYIQFHLLNKTKIELYSEAVSYLKTFTTSFPKETAQILYLIPLIEERPFNYYRHLTATLLEQTELGCYFYILEHLEAQRSASQLLSPITSKT